MQATDDSVNCCIVFVFISSSSDVWSRINCGSWMEFREKCDEHITIGKVEARPNITQSFLNAGNLNGCRQVYRSLLPLLVKRLWKVMFLHATRSEKKNILFKISNTMKVWKFPNKSTVSQHTSKRPLSSFLDFCFLMC